MKREETSEKELETQVENKNVFRALK